MQSGRFNAFESHKDSVTTITSALISAIRQQYRLDWNGVHGVRHWARVRRNGLWLSQTTGADTVVVEIFAFLHDSCRLNEHRDPDHGPRAARFATELQPMLGLLDRQLEQLVTACHGHTAVGFSDDPTVATCWDADRLDLWRVGIRPDPIRMNTAMAKTAGFMVRCGGES